jgi:hypothetical protein
MKHDEPTLELTLLPGEPSIEELLALFAHITGRPASHAEERELAQLMGSTFRR